MPNTLRSEIDGIKTAPVSSLPNDPSSLTTQQLWREIASLKELLVTRILAIEKAIEVAHEDLVRFPTEVDKRVGQLRDLHEEKLGNLKEDVGHLERLFKSELAGEHTLKEEKFEKVYQRFNLLEEARKEQKSDTNTAIERAFAAAKEAVVEQNKSNAAAIGKSDAGTQKQLDQLEQIGNTGRASLESKINDIKERMTKLEAMSSGIGMPTELNKRLAEMEHTLAMSAGRDSGPNKLDSETVIRLNTIEAMFSKMAGSDSGKRETSASIGAIVGYIFGAIGVIIAIISLISKMLPVTH